METGLGSLKEYQEQLLARIRDSAANGAATSYLGMVVAEERWAVRLTDVSEVIPVPTLHTVPLTQSWFLGITNIRGSLYAVADIAALIGRGHAPLNADTRLVLIHPRFRVNAGFIITRTLGLRNIPLPSQPPEKEEVSWITAEYHEPDGKVWKELDIRRLVSDPRFLDIASPRLTAAG